MLPDELLLDGSNGIYSFFHHHACARENGHCRVGTAHLCMFVWAAKRWAVPTLRWICILPHHVACSFNPNIQIIHHVLNGGCGASSPWPVFIYKLNGRIGMCQRFFYRRHTCARENGNCRVGTAHLCMFGWAAKRWAVPTLRWIFILPHHVACFFNPNIQIVRHESS
jgi:hypothetical protein